MLIQDFKSGIRVLLN